MTTRDIIRRVVLNEVRQLQKIAGILKEDNSNVHYYSPGRDIEKQAGISSFYSRPSRYSSPQNIISWAKKYLATYPLEQKIRFSPNSKRSFYISSDQSFNTEESKQKLKQFAKSWINGEGIQGIEITLQKPNKIYIKIDDINGIKFTNFDRDELYNDED